MRNVLLFSALLLLGLIGSQLLPHLIGLAWQLGVIVVIMVLMLAVAYILLHRVRIPISWPWVLSYAVGITVISELVYKSSILIDDSVPIHIEVLLPAFVLGCVVAYTGHGTGGSGEHRHAHAAIETKTEKRVAKIVAAVFMVMVGLSMPGIVGSDLALQERSIARDAASTLQAAGSPDATDRARKAGKADQVGRISSSQPSMGWMQLALHVMGITFVSNLGKMFIAFCYRREAHWRERLAVAIGMWPRGEVGAGVLVISMSYGIGGPIVTIAMLSLTLNLLLTGVFIYIVQFLTRPLPGYGEMEG